MAANIPSKHNASSTSLSVDSSRGGSGKPAGVALPSFYSETSLYQRKVPQCVLGGRKWADGGFVQGGAGMEDVNPSFWACSSRLPKAKCIQKEFRRTSREQTQLIARLSLARNESDIVCGTCRKSLGRLEKLAGVAGAALAGVAGAALSDAVITGDGGRREDSVTFKALFEFYKQQHAATKRDIARFKRDRYAPCTQWILLASSCLLLSCWLLAACYR